YLQPYSDIEISAECGDGFEGAKMIQQHRPDLIFLDIQMPKLTGFEMLEILDEMPNVIFTTAFDEFAIKAFEKNAIDYLLKPISNTWFEEANAKIRNKLQYTATTEITSKIEAIKDEEVLQRIVVKNGTPNKLIRVQQVVFFEAYDDYVKIHT